MTKQWHWWLLIGGGMLIGLLVMGWGVRGCVRELNRTEQVSSERYQARKEQLIRDGKYCPQGFSDAHDFQRLNNRQVFCRKCGYIRQ